MKNFVFGLFGLLFLTLLLSSELLAFVTGITHVSLGAGGAEADAGSYDASVSADGRFVAFESDATNLIASDSNGMRDIFVRDTQTNTTVVVSTSSTDALSNERSENPVISNNGQFIVFESLATNLVAGVTNSHVDIFIRDVMAGTTELISKDSNGNPSASGDSLFPSISADGRYVAFLSSAKLAVNDMNSEYDIYVHDRQTGMTTLVADTSDATSPKLSANGQFVAFATYSSLVAQDNGGQDVYVHDLANGSSDLVSISAAGVQQNFGSVSGIDLSADGNSVVFYSLASNLVSNDMNDSFDVFVKNRQTGEIVMVTVDSDGNQADAFGSWNPRISDNGMLVVFPSEATNLVANDTNGAGDVFVHNLATSETTLVSVDGAGNQGNGESYLRAISADSSQIVFNSFATNLTSSDTNSESDIFVVEFDLPDLLPNKIYLPTLISN